MKAQDGFVLATKKHIGDQSHLRTPLFSSSSPRQAQDVQARGRDFEKSLQICPVEGSQAAGWHLLLLAMTDSEKRT